MFGDMMGKLNDMKQQVAETKERLNTVYVSGESGSGAVKVTATANRAIKSVSIADELLSTDDKEELEDLLILALNKALENAEKVHEQEMKAAAQGLLPGMPGMPGLF